ncbi:MAG TPA: acyltransferase [Micromonosporaceae bacterium]|nr:acyltransferase [Micromonosporaceae bacterium]
MTRTKSPRLPALDALRGIGASAVVAGHVTFATGAVGIPYWGYWFSRLEVFVSVFFVLSGFVLYRPYAHALATGGKADSVGRHLWRRFLRIGPAYWLTAAVCLWLLVDKPVDLMTWAIHMTFTQFYVGLGGFQPGIGQAWSLTVEVIFYLLLPFMAAATLGRKWRPRRAALLCLLLVPVTVGWALAIGMGKLNVFIHPLWFPAYAGCFGVGMALATIHVALRTGTAPRSWKIIDDIGSAPWACWAFALGLFAITATPVAGPPGGLGIATGSEYAVRLVLYLAVASCLIVPVAFGHKTKLHTFLETIPMRWLGTVSYGLFLWHPFAMHLIDEISGVPPFGRDPLGMYILAMAGGLVLAAISWYCIERPAINWGRSRSSSKRPVGGKPEQDDRTQSGDLRPEGSVGFSQPISQPGAEEEQRRWQEPEPADRPAQLDLVLTGHAPTKEPGHEEHHHSGNGQAHADQTADEYERQTAEYIETLTAEAVTSRYVGRATVPRQHGSEQHESQRTSTH